MKVGTDSIMLGSWVQTNHARRILDIGSGCGLLAIMLAQKTPNNCVINGIDIDINAIAQSKDNAEKCPWGQRLVFKHTSLQEFENGVGYDLIVSNPPYFPINISANNALLTKIPTKNRINARQTVELDHLTLSQKVTEHLSDNGQFYCVLPIDIAKSFILHAESQGLFCSRELQVQPKQQTQVTRLLLEFSRIRKIRTVEKLSIYDHLGHYSEEYIALCKNYYLNF